MFVSLGADNDFYKIKLMRFVVKIFVFFSSYIHIFLILIKPMLHKNNTRHVHQEVNKGGYKKREGNERVFILLYKNYLTERNS